MKKILTIAVASLLLVGCENGLDLGLARPVVPPELPADLVKKSVALPPITSTDQNVLVVELANTQKAYNEVAYEKNTVVTIYNCVREVIAKRKKDIESCTE